MNTTSAHTASTCSPKFQCLFSNHHDQMRAYWKWPFKLNHRCITHLYYQLECCCWLIIFRFIVDSARLWLCPSPVHHYNASLIILHKVELSSTFKCCQITDLSPTAATSHSITPCEMRKCLSHDVTAGVNTHLETVRFNTRDLWCKVCQKVQRREVAKYESVCG